MVRHIHITVDDDTYDRLKAVKDEHGGTWEELLLDRLETQPADE
jgi:predicted CopG family antitoxin